MKLLGIFLFFFSSSLAVQRYKILGIFPYPARSHYTVFDALMVELAKRGHQVTVYNTFVKPYKIENYEEIDVASCFSLPTNILTFENMRTMFNGASGLAFAFSNFLPKQEEIMNCQPLKDLSESKVSYDLLITESFFSDFFHYFGYILNIPVIGFHSNTALPWMADQTGLPLNPSYIPHSYQPYPSPMTFRHRFFNALSYLYSKILYRTLSESPSEQIARTFFKFAGEVPPLREVTKNMSMMFLYTHFSLNSPRPLVPNVVEVAALNIKPAKKLPQNIEKFINESSHGVIYFCMGSLLRAEHFPAHIKNAFLYAFSRIPQRILWKWEGDDLSGKFSNIMTSDWMPQRDILAHPNVKLFISHGGLLGINEAVYEGVPVLGIPIFADQRSNIYVLESKRAGELLEYSNITKEHILEKIQKILNDQSYKKNAIDLSRRFKDRPTSALDTAVFWTEYVIRHKGAHHLKSFAVFMSWYQYFLIDVIGFLMLVSVIFVTLMYYIFDFLLRNVCKILFFYKKPNLIGKNKKVN